MKNILLSFVVIFLVFSYPTQAQTEDKINFTLAEAQQYALENSYTVKGTDYDLQVARKRVWETIADGLPQVDFSADYNNNLDVAVSLLPSEFFGGEPGTYTPIKFGQQYASSATLSVSQKIFDGSYIVGTMAARVFVQLSKDQKEKTEIEIKDAVAQAYFAVLVAKDNYNTVKDNLEINEKLLRETKAYWENGFREELDVDQIQLNLNTSKTQLSDAKRAITTSLTILKYTMGMDIDHAIELSNGLTNLVDPIRSSSPEISSYDAASHIDYRILETRLKSQNLLIKNEQAQYLPTISAFYRYGKNTSTDFRNVFKSEVPWFKSSVIGLQLNMPIFSAGKKRSRVKQQRIEYMKIENEMSMTQQNLKKELSLSFSNLLNAQETYENNLEGVQIAKRIYDRTIIKFNEGISTSTDLSDNEKQYLDAHSRYINSTLSLLSSKIAFDKALGKL
ncbi:TolC family protein [Marinifilum caeruleilacunae]|uniref:TolC family protein n=1 Tax=Marinifilum caeruleilacunae TaxID=2499076 RepID=A0ABX1X0E8_9BACT|nr:TolC family protein [Marinifilum caeruleilacunae]NOU61550.1 TolC family protein [Marinifilum caeruleilacunae]